MLHVFAVNQGHLMTFDIDLAMDKVIRLKTAIEQTCQVKTHKQVLLVKDGQAVEDGGKVCAFAAGTESNPFFMFDIAIVESVSPIRIPTPKLTEDFSMEIHSAVCLPPSYSTVVQRTKMAIRIKEATLNQVSILKTLTRDEHLMFEGWQAAFANLGNVLLDFEQRSQNLEKQCIAAFHQASSLEQVLEGCFVPWFAHLDKHCYYQQSLATGSVFTAALYQVHSIAEHCALGFDDVIELLSHIPLLRCLFPGEVESLHCGESLLDWIELRCRGPKICDLVAACKQQDVLLRQEKLAQLVEEGRESIKSARSPVMRDDSRVRGILEAQSELVVAAEREGSFQIGLAQGFVKNQETARQLREGSLNHDAMMTLCESHVRQLRKMHEVEKGTREAVRKCSQHKNYLMQTFHNSLKWLYAVERRIAKCDKEFSIFHDRLLEFHHKLKFLSAVKTSPKIYFSLLSESARRRIFSQAFTQWFDGVMATTCVARDREVARRRNIKKKLANHFLWQLVPGLADKPPTIAKRPMRKFDVNVAKVTHDDLQSLVNAAPQLKQYYDEIEFDDVQFPLQQSSTFAVQPTMTFPDQSAVTFAASAIVHSDSSVANESFGLVSPKPTDEQLTNTQDDFDTNLHPEISCSPPGGEFFSIQPLSLNLDHSFAPISPPGKATERAELLKIASNSRCSSDEEMFHSIADDVSGLQLMTSTRDSEEDLITKNEEMKLLIKKYEKNLNEIQLDRKRALIACEERISHLIGQLELEREQREKRQEADTGELACAWEKNNQLRTELALKNQEISERKDEIDKVKSRCSMEVADAKEKGRKEKWELESRLEQERKAYLCTIADLERNIKDRSDELASTEDHVQDLETQLSDAERQIATLNITIETCAAEVELCHNDVADLERRRHQAESECNSAKDQAALAEGEVKKMEETVHGLKAMLADYEVELETSKATADELRGLKKQFDEKRYELEIKQKQVFDLTQAQRGLEAEVEKLNEELNNYKSEVAQCEEVMGERIKEMQENHENVLLEVKQDAEENLKKIFDSNKKKMKVVVDEQAEGARKLREEHECTLEEMRKSHSNALDELRADHLDDLCQAQSEIAQLRTELEEQREEYKRELDDVTKKHEQQGMAKLELICYDHSMASSSGESNSKVARMDDVMTASMKEKEARREEAAIRRRQVMFNSAIQRLACAKDAEITRLKEQLSTNQMTASKQLSTNQMAASTVSLASADGLCMTSSFHPKDSEKVTVSNFQPDDLVIVKYDSRHRYHVLFNIRTTPYFVHKDSLTKLNVSLKDHPEQSFTLAKFVSKQYCQAKKIGNRFGVPVGTKFFHVKVAPYTVSPE